MLASINDDVHAVLYYLSVVAGLPDGGLLWTRQIAFDAIDRGSGIRPELFAMLRVLEKIRDDGPGV